jgi:hypothetical protein
MVETINEYAARWWAERLDDRHAAGRERFRLALLARLPDGDWKTYCDYDPRDELLDALRDAGIECAGSFFSAEGILPSKTGLSRRGNMLYPKEGYGNWVPAVAFPDTIPSG